MKGKKKLINREISWLAFNERVLNEAADVTVPLLERLKFLGIFSNNRDEFFRVRVASVRRLVALNEKSEDPEFDPKEVLSRIQSISLQQQKQYEAIYKTIIAELEEQGILLVDETKLNQKHKEFVEDFFRESIDPVMSPIILDQIKEFPHLKDKAIYLAVSLSLKKSSGKSAQRYALIEIPSDLPRFVPLPDHNEKKFIMIIDDIIRHNLMEIFSVFKPKSVEAFTFKITRDAELDLDNDISRSFMEKMQRSLKKRKRGAAVRFVYDSSMPKVLHRYLSIKMDLRTDEDALIPGGRYHNLKDLMSFPKVGVNKGYYRTLSPSPHPYLAKHESVFAAVRKKDVLLHFPYQSFHHVVDMLKEAALDPKVKTIRICLYRVAKRSRVINALISAARNGKKVVVVFELQARFDEENNIYWSNLLEDEGVKVYFGLPGFKVHSKICLISRKEHGTTVYYGKVGTGNFHEGTASLYGDLSLLTANPDITKELRRIFGLFENAIWPNYRFKHVVLSPFSFRNRLVRLINKEIKNAKDGKAAYIFLKMNSLVDTNLIFKLYDASKAGVQIRLIIRGICSLVPGVQGMSENIQVISIIDRYLEHARCYVFCNNDDPLYFISSADWMVRNLDRRIEVTCPIYDSDLKDELREFLEIQWRDTTKARTLFPNGEYKVVRQEKKEDIRSQYRLYDHYKRKSKEE